MIATFIYIIADICLQFLNWVLSVFTLPYVDNMTGAITWALSMINMLNNTFPVYSLFACMLVLLLTYFYKYQIKLFLHTIFPMIPIIGRRIDLPNLNELGPAQDDPSQPYYQSLRPDPNNKNGMGTFYLYKRKKTR